MNNNLHDETAHASAAGGKLKLSEVVAALENGTLELDCKAVLAVVSKEHTWGLFDRDLVDVSDRDDVQLLQLFLGLPAIACQFMRCEPEAMAALAAAYGRDCREDERGERLSSLVELVVLGEDGKEAEA